MVCCYLNCSSAECVRERNVSSPALTNAYMEVYLAVVDAYSKDRLVISRDPYLLADTFVEDGYLLPPKPFVDEVIHAQDLLREVEE